MQNIHTVNNVGKTYMAYENQQNIYNCIQDIIIANS